MARLITLRGRSASSALGFSLIEVMVAVVILATGLLALAALQGALARNSADAKARSAIMAALTSRMSQIRQGDIDCTLAPVDKPVGCDITWKAGDDWVDAASAQAGATGLTVKESISILYWNPSKKFLNVFVNGASSFTRANLEAKWTAADGAKSLTLASDLSGVMYGEGQGYPIIDPDGSASKRPVVRHADPGLEAGVIPIAYGTGDASRSTAASNPKPLLIGSTTVVGTQFDVLTYIPEGGDTAIIRRRVDTNLVKCRCSTGLAAKDRYSVSGVAQWPTIWDGDKYATYKPGDKSAPPAEALLAGEDPAFAGKSRAQSDLCTECCRDRIDSIAMPVKFGPEGEMQRYDLPADKVLIPALGATFVAACRVIGNDGIYKTASDMYLRQFGLLETTSDPVGSADPNKFAMSGVPTPSAAKNYGDFVKSLVAGYLPAPPSDGKPPKTAAEAQVLFDAFTPSLNVPTIIQIPAPGASDERFLHARGLYIDHLESDARTRIGKVLASCGSTLDCLLPHLAFTTINLTELSRWSTSDTVKDGTGGTKLNVTTSGTLLGTNVTEPMGGRTYGKANTTSSFTNAASTLSNSTIAFRADIPFTNLQEANPLNWVRDAQQFSVGAGGGPVEPPLNYIEIIPSGLLTAPATIAFTMIQTLKSSACNPGSSSYTCDVAVGNTLPGVVSLMISGFNKEEAVGSSVLVSVDGVCGKKAFSQPQPYRITYSGITVSTTEGGVPIGAFTPSVSRTATSVTWNSALVNNKDKLYATFEGGQKSCPAAVCNLTSDKFEGWGTSYLTAYCL